MKKNFRWMAATIAAAGVLTTATAWAHCEIPCGIYDDSLRMKLIYEDIATIAKSIHEINELEVSGKNVNQLVRWIINKDNHAEKLQQTVTQYFMTQRLRPTAPDAPGYQQYLAQLTTLHALLTEAMKAKQSSDPAVAARLRQLAGQFDKLYFQPEEAAATPNRQPQHP